MDVIDAGSARPVRVLRCTRLNIKNQALGIRSAFAISLAMWNMLKALWAFRHFVASSITNEFITRFARSRLGGLWMIIHPLAQVAIFTLILSNVLAAKLPGIENKNAYPLYLMAGNLGWNLFSEIVSRCLTLFIDQANLLKKIRFPRMALPAIVVGSSLLNHLLLFVSILVIFALMGQLPSIQTVWIPILTLTTLALALGIGLILGTMNVFFRDIGQVVPVLLQILFWFTPIVYPITTIPEHYRVWMHYNPLFALIDGYQRVLVYQSTPQLDLLAIAALLALGLLALSLILFRRASPELVDTL